MRFTDNQTIRIVERQRTTTPPEGNIERARFSVPGSSDVAGIELRMLPPLIKDNRTIKFWPFPGKAKLYCLTMIISDVANQLKGHMDLNGFANIGNGEYLPINKTIFYWEKPGNDTPAPNQLHVVCSIIKSKGRLRDVGNILSGVREDNEYKTLINQLSGLATNAANFNLVTEISLQLMALIGRYMGRVEDRPIGAVVHSFTRLHGDWDELGVKPIHVSTRNVDFDFELVVRDEERYILEHRQVFLPTGKQPVSYSSEPLMPM
jgi:hypothetical protein